MPVDPNDPGVWIDAQGNRSPIRTPRPAGAPNPFLRDPADTGPGDPFRYSGGGPEAQAAGDRIFPSGSGPGGFDARLRGLMPLVNAAPRANPYDQVLADRSRAPQQALYALMLAQARGGPSVSGFQSDMASDQGMQEQAGAMAGRPGGLGARGALTQGAQVNSGLAQQAGQNRLAESMSQAGQAGAGVGGMRGRDINSAAERAQSGLQMRTLDDAGTRFYMSQGLDLASAQRQSALEGYKFRKRLQLQQRTKDEKTTRDIIAGVGTAASTIAKM